MGEMQKWIAWGCGLLGLLLSSLSLAEAPAGYDFLPYDQGIQLAQSTNKKAFIYFGRPGCGFCQMANKQVFSRDEIRKAYSAHYVLIYVNSESGKRLRLPNGERITEMQLGERMNTRGTPVFIFVEPDGKPILKRFGVQSLETMRLLDRYVHEGHYQKQIRFDDFEKQMP